MGGRRGATKGFHRNQMIYDSSKKKKIFLCGRSGAGLEIKFFFFSDCKYIYILY